MKKMNFVILWLVGVLLESRMIQSESTDTKHVAAEKVDNSGNTTSIVEKISTYSAPFVSHDVSWSNDIGQLLFFSGVVFSGLALAVAFVWLLAPVFGYKFCAILGTCGNGGDSGEESVTVNGSEDGSSFYPFPVGYHYNQVPYAGYRKRSLNYVGPILKMLSSAYEKYEEFSSTTPKTE